MEKRGIGIDLGLGATYPRLGPFEFKLVWLRTKVQTSTNRGSAGYGLRSTRGEFRVGQPTRVSPGRVAFGLGREVRLLLLFCEVGSKGALGRSGN